VTRDDRNELPLLIVAAAVIAVLVAAFVFLAAIGRPTEGFVLFVSGPTVSTIVGAVLAKRVAAVESVARQALAATADMVPSSVAIAAGLTVPGDSAATPGRALSVVAGQARNAGSRSA
jgi:hypothetical protein